MVAKFALFALRLSEMYQIRLMVAKLGKPFATVLRSANRPIY